MSDDSTAQPGDAGTREHVLPDDVDLWPNEPEKILGVTKSSARKDVKRAYTRLIRRFKPEHFPEQFRRLREAFDQIDGFLQWREHLARQGFSVEMNEDGDGAKIAIREIRLTDSDDNSTRPAAGADNSTESAEQNHVSFAADVEDRQSSPVEKASSRDEPPPSNQPSTLPPVREPGTGRNGADQFWQTAIDGGNVVDAYRGLARLAAQGTLSEVDYARLYWLLTLHPDGDVHGSPIDWLVEGIKRHGPAGRLVGLYCNELDRHPNEIHRERSLALLDLTARQGRVVEMARARWIAARKLGAFLLISEDLERVRHRMFDDLDGWSLLLLGSMHQCALSEDATAASRWKASEAELRTLLEGNPSHWLWDSFDLLLNQHGEWQRKKSQLEGIISPLEQFVLLIEQTWNSSPSDARVPLVDYCRQFVETSPDGLSHWNLLATSSRPLLIRFLELMQEQRNDDGGSNRQQEVTPAAQVELIRYVKDVATRFGNLTQLDVLEFCLRESFTTDDIARTIDELAEELPPESPEVAESIRRDLVLRVSLAAHRLLN